MGELQYHVISRVVFALLILISGSVVPGPCPAATHSAPAPLVLGVFPRRPALKTEAMFAPLAARLAEALQRPVSLDVAPDFPAFWAAVRANRYQLVHYNPYHYVRAHHEFGHRLVAMNEEFGSNRIRPAIWVRKDRGLKGAEQLHQAKIAFGGGRDAMVSFIMTSDLLQQAGLTPADYIAQFTVNPTRAMMAMYYRQSDAAGLNANATRQPAMRQRVDPDQVEPLLVGEPVAMHPWAVNAAVTPALQQRIGHALLGMTDSAAGRDALARAELTGLTPAADTDYEPHRRIIERVLGERY